MVGFGLAVLTVVGLAVVGVASTLRRDPSRLVVVSVASVLVLSVQYVARAGGVYTVLVVPFLSVLAAVGARELLGG
jgi:predicted membrane metal-binding protein